ncbi:hypothetical protein GCM10008164_00810 [Achromobacter xylosoxidans]|nr:hypothetical protein GCM10008164_00810 [Achromobacter xylosoxidans]
MDGFWRNLEAPLSSGIFRPNTIKIHIHFLLWIFSNAEEQKVPKGRNTSPPIGLITPFQKPRKNCQKGQALAARSADQMLAQRCAINKQPTDRFSFACIKRLAPRGASFKPRTV